MVSICYNEICLPTHQSILKQSSRASSSISSRIKLSSVKLSKNKEQEFVEGEKNAVVEKEQYKREKLFC